MSITLEVICVTVDDAIAAEEGGADRIELIDNYSEGGTTPSAGIIRAVTQAVSIPVYVMIRPRGGSFVYSKEELKAMVVDARLARDMGADGIVTGVLTPDESVDVEATGRVVEAAQLPTTFHRAFDELSRSEMSRALKQLASMPSIERVLTSGGQPTAFEGREVLAELVAQHSGIAIMPGGDVTLENVRQIVGETGVTDVHVGLAARNPQTATARVSGERVRILREATNINVY